MAMNAERLRACLLYLLYIGINVLFVAKYAPRYGLPGNWVIALSILFFVAVAWCAGREVPHRFFSGRAAYFSMLAAAAVFLAALMYQFDPALLRSGRAPAINDWLGRFLSGEFPYAGGTYPSAFPFLFLLGLPFYLLGELGWWQIAGFVLFGLLLCKSRSSAAGGLILLLCSPVFLYEVVVRSELFSNMVVVLAYLRIVEHYRGRAGSGRILILGLLGGLVLSTRGIVLLAYAVYFIYVFRRDLRTGLIFTLGVVVSFAATVFPFVIWNAEGFSQHGPFAIQTSYLSPVWILALVVMGIVYGVRVRSVTGVYTGIALILFLAAAIPFVESLLTIGWANAIWHDKFDISYFCFSLPFVIIAARFSVR